MGIKTGSIVAILGLCMSCAYVQRVFSPGRTDGAIVRACNDAEVSVLQTSAIDRPTLHLACVATGKLCAATEEGPTKEAARLYTATTLALINTLPDEAISRLENGSGNIAFDLMWYGIHQGLSKVQDPQLWVAYEMPVANAVLSGCLAGLGPSPVISAPATVA